VAAELRGGHCAAAFLAGPVQHAGQRHGVVAEGADNQKLFTNGRGGHAGFLTQMKTTPKASKRGRKGSEKRRPKEWRAPGTSLVRGRGRQYHWPLSFLAGVVVDDFGQHGGAGHSHGCAGRTGL